MLNMKSCLYMKYLELHVSIVICPISVSAQFTSTFTTFIVIHQFPHPLMLILEALLNCHSLALAPRETT